jgi:SAM-dependent methyltransferase
VVEVGSVTFFVRDIDEEAPARLLPGFTVRQLQAIDRDAVLHGSESSWEALTARFERGDLCFGALNDRGLAVHTRWLTLAGARIPELDLDFVPTPDAAYFFDGYTRPDARKRGIDAVVRAAIFEALRVLGRRRVYSYVRDDNPGGLRAARRCQRSAGTLRYVRLFGSRPRVFGADRGRLDALLEARAPENVDARMIRAAQWRRWFEGWLNEPLAKRSIGFHELPEDAFKAMAHHISSTLHLDPSRDVVLDLGCDSALVTLWVAPHCTRLVGVDFIPGMLVDAKRRRDRETATVDDLRFAAADGRALPFSSETFAKAYSSGVVHTLPSQGDGLAMILEMVRVVKPGGQVLIAAVPDVRKRWRARREAFRLGGFGDRARIFLAAVVPAPLKRLARRVAPWLPPAPLRYLEYDLREVSSLLEGRGLTCAILDYPRDFWSRDFRETRSNLLIAVPNGAATSAVPSSIPHPAPSGESDRL